MSWTLVSDVTIERSPSADPGTVQDALNSTKLIMEDKYDEAAKILEAASSPFHKFLLGICYFQRAVIGTEPETIKAGLPVLANAEQVVLDFHTRALQDPSVTHSSKIYPPGTVYSLMQAEIQFMYAVVAIANASFSDAIKALMKMRKAYITMQQIFKLEQDYARDHRPQRGDSDATSFKTTNSRRSFDFKLAGDGADFAEMTSDPIDVFVGSTTCH